MLNRMIGIALFAAAFVVEFFWLGLAFGSVIVGLVLLIFAPAILLAPFQILLTLGLAFYHRDRLREAAEEWNRDYFRYEEEEIDPGEWHLGDLNRHYATLGCAPTDDMEKIKAAYRRLSKEFHPDRVEGRGMGRSSSPSPNAGCRRSTKPTGPSEPPTPGRTVRMGESMRPEDRAVS